MAGIGDKLRSAILDLVPNDAARKVGAALGGTTGTTSGLDKAMQDHADQQHPVSQRQPTRVRKDGSLILMGDKDY